MNVQPYDMRLSNSTMPYNAVQMILSTLLSFGSLSGGGQCMSLNPSVQRGRTFASEAIGWTCIALQNLDCALLLYNSCSPFPMT